MQFELVCLAWTLVLAIVYIMAAGQARTNQYGKEWNMSARDSQQPPLNPVAARLVRAQANLFETLPLYAAAVLIAVVADKTGMLTYWGSLIYLVARIIYLPLYAFGIPVVRTIVWLISIAGLSMILVAILLPK